MYRFNNIKQSILIVSFAALVTGCGGGGGTTTVTTATDSTHSTTTTTEILKAVAVQTSEPIITENSATITWIQNDYTTELVEYGTSKKYDSELLVKEEGTITLYNLQANTTYHYRIVAKDKNGRKVVSRDKTFTTLEQSNQIVPEPVPTEPTPDPIVEPTPEPIVEPTPDPIVEPTPDPIVEPTPDPIVVPTPIPTTNAIHQGKVKDNSTGNGLENVKVSIGEFTTTTDENGLYTLSDLSEKEEAVINFEKEGYLLGSTKIQIKELSEDNTPSTNYLEYTMHAKNYEWDYNSNDEVAGAHIIIDASVSYENINRKSYTGTNTAELIYFDITSNEGKSAFPGAFKGINSNGTMVQFETYGLISILLKDSNSNKLRLAEGETATLRFDAVSSLENPDTLPLWSYDYDQGLWFEEGYAQLQEDGSYKGDISHLGTWSLNKPLEEEAGIYRGRIVDEDGSPISDVRLQAIGNNWISNDLSTDEDGVFEIEVIPGEDFKLKAYHYEDKYEASYSNKIAAIASGEIIEN